MKNKYLHITQNSPCPPVKQLELYQQGKLLNAERFEIENHLASCEICNDIIEGLIYINDANTLPLIEKELQLRLEEMLDLNQRNKRTILYRRLAFAASIILIISISFIVYYSIHTKSTIQTFQPIATIDSAVKTQQPDSTKPENIKIAQAKKERVLVAKPNKSYEITVADEVVELASEVSVSNEFVVAEQETMEQKASPAIINLSQLANNLETRNNLGTRKIAGIITDERGEPLPGATIIINGTKNGVTSDVDGNFELQLEQNVKDLNVSYVGYNTESITLNNDSVIKISLQPSMMALDEVVVVGYGSRKKSQLTSAVSRVTSSDMEKPFSAKRMRELQYSNDTLKQALNNSNNKWLINKQLAENYIELHESLNAIYALNNLSKLIEDTVKQNYINDVIKNIEKGKFKKARRQLRKME